MDKYNPDGKCIKCGSGEIEDEHREAYIPPEHVKALAEALGNKIDSKPERIVRLCKNCGFPWLEAPLNPTSFKASDICQPENVHTYDPPPAEIKVGDTVNAEKDIEHPYHSEMTVLYIDPDGQYHLILSDGFIGKMRSRELLTLIRKGPSKPIEIDMGQVEVSGSGRYFTVPMLPQGTPDGLYNVTLRPVEDSQ